MIFRSFLTSVILLSSLVVHSQEWAEYGGSEVMGTKYSRAGVLKPGNVSGLKLHWQIDLKTFLKEDFSSIDVPEINGVRVSERRALQLTPIYTNGQLYGCSNFNRVFSLDVTNKKENWIFTPPSFEFSKVWGHRCRGVSYWENASKKPRDFCQKVIFSNSMDGKLYAVDANSGGLCQNFGVGGVVDLKSDVGVTPAARSEFTMVSAPLVYSRGRESLIVVGGSIWDNSFVETASGVVRAYDAETGRLAWSWDPVLKKGEGFVPGTPNAWAPLSYDAKLGLIVVPMGNASPDLFGGLRGDKDHFASSLVALDARDGSVRWRFKTVQNDVWDYDVPTQPALFTLKVNGTTTPVVAIGTKMGFIFVLDRRTGREIRLSQLVNVPTSMGVPGERLSPTQLRSQLAFHPDPKTAEDLVDPFIVHLEKQIIAKQGLAGIQTCLERARSFDFEGIFTPPSLKGGITYPGPIGGLDWGGLTIDPVRRLMIFNQNHLAAVTKLIPRKEYEEEKRNSQLNGQLKGNYSDMKGTPYGAKREAFSSQVLPGVSCVRGPWGTMTAIDLDTGKVKWNRPLGSTSLMAKGTPLEAAFTPESLKAFGEKIRQEDFARSLGFSKAIQNYSVTEFGTLNLGGSLVTSTGIVVIGATLDRRMRVLDVTTGETLREFELPAAGSSNPMTFVEGGRQYVVISSGGNLIFGGKTGDDLMIFSSF